MGIKNKKNSFTILNVLGRVGWLEKIEKSVIKNEENAYLLPGLACRKTCGWTHCNMRCTLQHRGSQYFSAIGLANEKKAFHLHANGREIRKAV